jgi:shikimate kinase
VAVVGPCGAGKTTLVHGLGARGIAARQIAQEHSFVPDLWRFAAPRALIYLDASFTTCTRRKRFDWKPEEYGEQLRRLTDARRHCSLYVATDDMSPEAVLEAVLSELARLGQE